MPRFEPFRGIRYDTHRFDPALVTAPPYDVIDAEERTRRLADDEHCVVAIDIPVAEDSSGRTESSADAYRQAADRLGEWRASGVLTEDAHPTFTIYRMETTEGAGRQGAVHRTTGVIGALALGRPEDGEILPHEFTTPKAKSDRRELLRATRANLSPVWGLSPVPGLTDLLEPQTEPELRFTADGVTHSVWTVADPSTCRRISDAIGAAPIVIADGHHRYETSLAYRAEQSAAGASDPGAEAVMCFVVELADDTLSVAPIHRLLDGLPTDVDLLSALEPSFEIRSAEIGAHTPIRELIDAGAIGLVTPDGRAWHLTARPHLVAGARDLDSSRLDLALSLLPSHELTYQHGVDNVVRRVRAGDAQAGFLLRPVRVAQIVEIAEGGERMPPKSTFFHPKPRTGIVFRDLGRLGD